jgi:hypothetical protein
MTGRNFRCLTCNAMVSDKYIHKRRTEHEKFLQIGTEGEEELSPTTKWTQELMTDELAGMKRVMLKLETHKAITEISSQSNGATYDDIILAALGALKREKENKGYDQLESIVSDSNEEE